MSPSTMTIPHKMRWPIALIILGAVAVAFFVSASLVAGYGLNLRGFGRMLLNTTLAVANSRSVAPHSTGEHRNIVFLHQSVGANLVDEGSVREKFTAAGYSFWDQGYNHDQLRDPLGRKTGYAYHVPGNNTYPDGLLAVFTQPVFGLPLNTLSGLLQHEVIAFKSCYPASDITSDQQLEERKDWYGRMRDTMDQHPDKLFIVMTQPPLNPAATNPDIAARARSFANWLKSDEFLKGHPNIVTFDLFDRLAESDPQRPDFNMLRQDYREEADSHPTPIANETIGPQFVDFVNDAIERYKQLRGL